MSDVKADTFGSPEQKQGLPPSPFHRIHYTYDKVGNVTPHGQQRVGAVLRPDGVFIGPLDVTYTYDNLYQLKSLSGKYRAHGRTSAISTPTRTRTTRSGTSRPRRSRRIGWSGTTRSINTSDRTR